MNQGFQGHHKLNSSDLNRKWGLNTPEQHKNGHNREERSYAARWVIPPTPAVRPGRQGADQHEDKDDKEDCSQHVIPYEGC